MNAREFMAKHQACRKKFDRLQLSGTYDSNNQRIIARIRDVGERRKVQKKISQRRHSISPHRHSYIIMKLTVINRRDMGAYCSISTSSHLWSAPLIPSLISNIEI